jgi:Ca2+-binding EF-hand superfamily protein
VSARGTQLQRSASKSSGSISSSAIVAARKKRRRQRGRQGAIEANWRYDAVSQLHGFLSQKNIRALLRQTNYNRRELYVIYVRFKALCALSPSPRGIDKITFKKGVSRLAVEDEMFVNRVFSLVDDDGSGQIEWKEFLTAMSALEKGSTEIKSRFFFQIYDLDADTYISRADLAKMFHSSSMLDADETTAEVVRTFVNKVFSLFKAEESGKISYEDVLRYMKREGNKKGEDVWDIFGRSMLKDFGS